MGASRISDDDCSVTDDQPLITIARLTKLTSNSTVALCVPWLPMIWNISMKMDERTATRRTIYHVYTSRITIS